MLGQRRRRWANIKTTLVLRLVLSGYLTTATAQQHEALTHCWFDPLSAEISLYKPRDQRVFTIRNHHKCPSYLFPIHMNTYVIRQRPL